MVRDRGDGQGSGGNAAPPAASVGAGRMSGVESGIAAPTPTGGTQGTLTLLARFLHSRAGVKRERVGMSEGTPGSVEHSANDINYDVWRLFGFYTLPQAAALMANIDPSAIEYGDASTSLRIKHGVPQDRRAAQANAIFHALINEVFRDKDGHLQIADFSRVAVRKSVFIDWLCKKENIPAFFANDVIQHKVNEARDWAMDRAMDIAFRRMERLQEFEAAQHDLINNQSASPNTPDYLNPDHPRYAPKLAVAIKAWQEVTDPRGKTPLQALREYLESNAQELGLLKDDGTFNREGMEQIAKVANWQPTGGAPKTPG